MPIKTLTRKLHVEAYDVSAPLRPFARVPKRLTLPLKQSAGNVSAAVVRTSDRVSAGQVLARPPAGALGAVLHAPAASVIEQLSAEKLVLACQT